MHGENPLTTLLRMAKGDRERYIKEAKRLARFTHQTVEEALEYLLDRRFGG